MYSSKKRASDYCLTPTQLFFSYIMARTSYIQWNDHDVRFVLDQHAKMDFYSNSSLKYGQSAGRHVAPLGHNILIPSQPVFGLTPYYCVLSGEATNTNFIEKKRRNKTTNIYTFCIVAKKNSSMRIIIIQ
jgi:hypothetical protein